MSRHPTLGTYSVDIVKMVLEEYQSSFCLYNSIFVLYRIKYAMGIILLGIIDTLMFRIFINIL